MIACSLSSRINLPCPLWRAITPAYHTLSVHEVFSSRALDLGEYSTLGYGRPCSPVLLLGQSDSQAQVSIPSAAHSILDSLEQKRLGLYGWSRLGVVLACLGYVERTVEFPPARQSG